MRSRKDDFLKAGAGIVLVGMGTAHDSAEFVRRQDLPFPLIADPKGSLYAAYGLEKCSLASLFSPVLLGKAMAALGQGYSVGRPIGDIRQLPGVVIIDTGGHIVFRHTAADAADHPDADAILARLPKAA